MIYLRKLIDLTGIKFGELKVLKRDESKTTKSTSWICQCSCGRKLSIVGERLKTGKSKSCGCKRAEFKIKTLGMHGQSNTRLYRIWCGMKERCNGTNDTRCNDYQK